MDVRLRPLKDQVVVITGASSGIGLATARLAAERGAAVVMTARSGEALEEAAHRIRSSGGQVSHVVADVGDAAAVEAVGEHALREFGRVDSWVNNAGATIYGRILDTPQEDARRLFETNFWGVVNGSLTAIELLRSRGGALINVGSMVSDVPLPLIGFYTASKQAVKGFTDVLRMECEKDALPISVSLVKPSATDTPFTEHARNLMEREPAYPPPVYDPEVVARTILHCAEKRVREVFVGGGGGMFGAMERHAPRLTERYLEATMFEQQKKNERRRPEHGDSLHAPSGNFYGRERGVHDGHVMSSSLYTSAKLHPLTTIVATAAAVVAVGRGLQRLTGA
jgi:short-subunit dehydrogenase